MGFSRQARWSGLPFPSPGHLPDPGTEPTAGRFFTIWATREALSTGISRQMNRFFKSLLKPDLPWASFSTEKSSCFVSFRSSTYVYNLHGFFFSSALTTFNLSYNLFLLSSSISGKMLSALTACSLNYPQSMAQCLARCRYLAIIPQGHVRRPWLPVSSL